MTAAGPWKAWRTCTCTGLRYALLLTGGRTVPDAGAALASSGYWVLAGLKHNGMVTDCATLATEGVARWLETNGPFMQVCGWPANSEEDGHELRVVLDKVLR